MYKETNNQTEGQTDKHTNRERGRETNRLCVNEDTDIENEKGSLKLD
jgi:hypothetical protein